MGCRTHENSALLSIFLMRAAPKISSLYTSGVDQKGGPERRFYVIEPCDIPSALHVDPVALFKEFLGEKPKI